MSIRRELVDAGKVDGPEQHPQLRLAGLKAELDPAVLLLVCVWLAAEKLQLCVW